MKLNDLIEQLGFGELSQHKLSASGIILPADYPTVISHINRGLTALHSRFPLSHKELTLIQFEGITDYKLDVKYSVSADDPSVTDKYIYDTVDSPFLDDLIRVEAAYDELGYNIPLNDEAKSASWFTPTNDSIQIPLPVEGAISSVMYRANHARIDLQVEDTSTVLVDIPQCLEIALSAYVASRAFTSLGNQSSAQLSSFYNQMYNNEVNLVERLNLLQTSTDSSSSKFSKGGWV